MRIALCISGQARNSTSGYAGIKKHIIDFNTNKGHSIDTYIHTWKTDAVDIGLPCTKSFETKLESHNTLLSLYNPESWMVEQQLKFDSSKHFVPVYLGGSEDGRACFNHQSMFYSILACNNLKTTRERIENFKYDLVIRIRPDCRVLYDVDLISIDTNFIYHRGDTPPKNVDSRVPNYPGKMNDHFAICNSKNMDIYSDCYNRLDELIRSGVPANPEFLLGIWIDRNNIERRIIKFNELNHAINSAIIR
tara:strand:- start:1158 stop:1904 length:747 start_codon:yes stop_codon:yes gene_type:complete